MQITFNPKALVKFAAILCLASIAVMIFVHVRQPNENYIKTNAVITDSYDEWVNDGDSNTLRTTYYIDYSVGGESYRHVEAPFSDPDFEVGKQIEIFYNPDDPTDIRYDSKGMMTYLIIVAAVSFVFTVGGAVLLRTKSSHY